jgi:hypothetical protein
LFPFPSQVITISDKHDLLEFTLLQVACPQWDTECTQPQKRAVASRKDAYYYMIVKYDLFSLAAILEGEKQIRLVKSGLKAHVCHHNTLTTVAVSKSTFSHQWYVPVESNMWVCTPLIRSPILKGH